MFEAEILQECQAVRLSIQGLWRGGHLQYSRLTE